LLAAVIVIIDTGGPLNRHGEPMGIKRLNFADAATVNDTDGHATVVDRAARSVAPDSVRYVYAKVSDDNGRISVSATNEALEWCVDYRGAHTIIDVTLAQGTGGNFQSTPAWAMYEENLSALKAKGITVVAAAGNSYGGEPGATYPGISRYVVCAMASAGNKLQPFSQRIYAGLAMDAGSTSQATGKVAGALAWASYEVLRKYGDWIFDGADRYRKIDLAEVMEAS
jgi:hypothetical protein